VSANTWISTWRAPSINFSSSSSPLPNALRASLLADSIAAASCSGASTRRIPRPPPPAVALSSTG
jgi:hypothetical protein